MRNLNIFLVFSALLVCILATPTPRDPAPVSLDPTGFRTSAGNDNATNARAPPSDDDKYVAGWAIISPGDPGYAAAAANLAVHDASASRGSLKCETTHSSPIVNDVHMVGQILARKPKAVLCMNTNGFGSHCTRMKNWGTAAASACSGPPLQAVTCRAAGLAVQEVAFRCDWRGLAGGIFYFDQWYHVAVHGS